MGNKFLNSLSTTVREYRAGLNSGILSEISTRVLFYLALLMVPIAILFLMLVKPLLIDSNPNRSESRVDARKSSTPAKLPANRYVRDQMIISSHQDTEQYWKSRLQMAKTDSIYLSVDLIDSTVFLEIKGVLLRSSKISVFRTSRYLSYLKNRKHLLSRLEKPFTAFSESATIPKSPIRIVNAPRDTVEAQDLLTMEIPEPEKNIRFLIRFDRNLVVEFTQFEPPSFWGKIKFIFFDIQKDLYLFSHNLLSLLRFSSPEPELYIFIKIPAGDARAIYRALPSRAQLGLRL